METKYFLLQYTLEPNEDPQQTIDTLDEYHIQFQIQFINNKTIIQAIYKLDYDNPEELYQPYRILNALVAIDTTFTYQSFNHPINLFEFEHKTI